MNLEDEKGFDVWGVEAEGVLEKILEKSSRGGFVYLMWVREFGECN